MTWLQKKRILIPLSVAVTLVLTLVIQRAYFSSKFEKVTPRVGPIVEAVYALGTVKSDQLYAQKFGFTGTIERLYVREGDEVKKGAPLLLSDSGVTFRAPFEGTITRLYFHEKEIVSPGAVILTLVNQGELYIEVSLDQESALLIRRGQEAELSFETIRGQKAKGRVSAVYPSEGQFLVRIDTDALPGEILSEMTADVAIEISRREKALLIPLAAIERGVVRLERKGKEQRINVKVGAIDGTWAEALDESVLPDDLVFVPVVKKKEE